MEQATPFGYKTAWWAFESADPQDVMARLGVRDPRQVPWSEWGSSWPEYHDGRDAAVTPVIDGWVLVECRALFAQVFENRTEDDQVSERALQFLGEVAALSGALGGAVQVFASNRFYGHYAFILAEGGRLRRAYAETDGLCYDIGDPTAAENELGLVFNSVYQGFVVNATAGRLPQGTEGSVSEDEILEIAERWSVNPRQLAERHLPRGWVGALSGSAVDR